MGVRPRRFTEEEVSRLSYELAIARVGGGLHEVGLHFRRSCDAGGSS